ncbi:MAG TPA: hypothetical protein VM367_14430 [Pseudonocardia sp.]|jgi:hypothetical protein|nr:hypothetical protein [Pseudonocardia sp.]
MTSTQYRTEAPAAPSMADALATWSDAMFDVAGTALAAQARLARDLLLAAAPAVDTARGAALRTARQGMQAGQDMSERLTETARDAVEQTTQDVADRSAQTTQETAPTRHAADDVAERGGADRAPKGQKTLGSDAARVRPGKNRS